MTFSDERKKIPGPYTRFVQPTDPMPQSSSSLKRLLERNGAMEVLVCAVTALAYLGTLSFGFVYDDKPVIVDNLAIRSWGPVARYVGQGAGSLQLPGGGTFYRPVTLLWLRLNYLLFGLRPAGWHFAMLLCHVLMAYLVFVLAEKLTGQRSTAAIAALLFGLHPVHVENVAWLSSVNDLLMSLLLMASVLAYLKSRDGPKAWMAASLFFFGLALMAKETAAAFPQLILGFALLYPAQPKTEENARGRWKESAVCLPYLAILFLYLAARRAMLHGFLTPIAPVSWKTMAFTWLSVLWFDLKHLVLPASSSEFYSLAYITKPTFSNMLLPGLLVVVALLAAIYWISALRERRLGLFSLLWIAVPILPTLYLRAIAPDNFVHDRFLYLPSVGVVMLAALAIEQVGGLKMLEPNGERAKWGVLGVVAAAAFAGVIIHQLPWANNLLLYQNGLRHAPDNLVVQDNLANEFVNQGRYGAAIPLYLGVLQKNPQFWSSNYNLGYTYFRAGRYREAEDYLNRAIQIDDRDADDFIVLARVQMEQGNLEGAAQSAERALQRAPETPGLHLLLARIFELSGKREQAISEYKMELQYHPDSAAAKGQLERLETPQPAGR